jgi:hypothetical protein
MLAAVARLAAALAGAQLALEFVVRARRNGQGIPGAIKREHAQELEELLRGVEPGHWADRDLGGGVINDEAVRIANEIVRDLWAAKLDGPEADMNRVLDCVVRSIGSV